MENNQIENKDNNDKCDIKTPINDTKDEYFYNFKIKFENCIDVIYKYFNKIINLISPIFTFFLFCLIFISAKHFLNSVLYYWSIIMENNVLLHYILFLVFVYLLFMLCFNLILAIVIKPGSVDDIKNSKFYKKTDSYIFLESSKENHQLSLNNILNEHKNILNEKIKFAEEFYKFKKNSEQINKYQRSKSQGHGAGNYQKLDSNSFKNLNSSEGKTFFDSMNTNLNYIEEINEILYSIDFPYCESCENIKPFRTHHCSICNVCVIKMDHHCPWINNCVGHYNHKYFLLFLLFLFLYSLYYALLITPIFFSENPITKEFSFVCVLSLASSVMMLFFNIWNWTLCFTGITAMEFWSNRMGNNKYKLKSFNFDSWRDNFYYIFGSRDIFKSIFIPSKRRICFSGLELSRLLNPRFKIPGIEDININISNSEENKFLINHLDKNSNQNKVLTV